MNIRFSVVHMKRKSIFNNVIFLSELSYKEEINSFIEFIDYLYLNNLNKKSIIKFIGQLHNGRKYLDNFYLIEFIIESKETKNKLYLTIDKNKPKIGYGLLKVPEKFREELLINKTGNKLEIDNMEKILFYDLMESELISFMDDIVNLSRLKRSKKYKNNN